MTNGKNNRTVPPLPYPKWSPVFTTGCDYFVPHCYLVFHDFDYTLAGNDTCVVHHFGNVTSSANIQVKLSNKTEDLGECIRDLHQQLEDTTETSECVCATWMTTWLLTFTIRCAGIRYCQAHLGTIAHQYATSGITFWLHRATQNNK